MFLYRVFAVVLWASPFCFTANADSVTDELSKIPPCGIQCIAEKAPLVGCGLLDFQCQCTSQNATQILQPCLLEQCTFDETFEILRVQATLCHKPHNSYTTAFKITAYVTGIIPVVTVSMRFASRWLGGNNFWWDDWLHLVSAVLCVPLTAILLLSTKQGIGRHIWDLSYDRVVAVSKLTWIATIIWGFSLLILKYSILCLYLRIFPNVWLKRCVFIFMALTACFTLPLLGIATFQCNPVKAAWDLEAAKTAKCIDYVTVLRLSVFYEVFAEVVLFGLPLPIVFKLQMKTYKKIQLCLFFGMGLFVIGLSIARVPFLKGVVDPSDQTYTVTGAALTGYASSAVGHVCAAVPTVRALTRHILNGFKSETKADLSYAQDDSYESRAKRSYKSLDGMKNSKNAATNYSGATLGAPNRSKGSDDVLDPYRLSAFQDAGGVNSFLELQPVETFVTKYTQQKGSAQAVGGLQSQPNGSLTVRKVSGDSASDEEVLVKDYLK